MAICAPDVRAKGWQEVSIPKRVSEVLWLPFNAKNAIYPLFQSLKGFQRFCGPHRQRVYLKAIASFQSLKGFQRFCGLRRSMLPMSAGDCFNP